MKAALDAIRASSHTPSALAAIAHWDAPDGILIRVDVTLARFDTESEVPKFATVVIRPGSGAREVICGLDRAAHHLLRFNEPSEGTEFFDHLRLAQDRFEEGLSK